MEPIYLPSFSKAEGNVVHGLAKDDNVRALRRETEVSAGKSCSTKRACEATEGGKDKDVALTIRGIYVLKLIIVFIKTMIVF